MMSGERKEECGICFGSINEHRQPRIIHETNGGSEHAACADCIARHLDNETRIIECPWCRVRVKINGPISDLPISFNQINKETTTLPVPPNCGDCLKATAQCACTKCRIYMCESCARHHKNTNDGHDQKDISEFTEEEKGNFIASQKCSEKDHSNILNKYCRSCKTPCCDTCVVERHQKCESVDIRTFLAEDNVTGKITTAEKMLKGIEANRSRIEEDIEEIFEKAISGLNDRKKELKVEAARKTDEQREPIKSILKQINDSWILVDTWPKFDMDLIKFGREHEEELKSLSEITNDGDGKEKSKNGCNFVLGGDPNIVQSFLAATIESQGRRGSRERRLSAGSQIETQDTIRILVIGKKKSGRGKTAYSFMDPAKPKSDRGAKTWIKTIQSRKVKLVYTAGLDNPNYRGGKKREKEDIRHFLSPGPTVVLFVVKDDSQEQIKFLEEYRAMFERDISSHIILVYSGKKSLDERGVSVVEYLQSRTGSMKQLLEATGHRFVAFNPSADKEGLQQFRKELLEQILRMWEHNMDTPLC